ncbi:MAG TPA: MFS transporter [Polyangiaceae bacterium]
MTRLFDVRAGEGRGSLGFAALLLLVIAAHTVLETARDALLLTGPGPRALGVVYMGIAAGTVPGTALAARTGERFGQRRALGAILVIAVIGPVLLFAVPTSPAMAMATYVLSGILGSIVVPQFWTLAGTVLTVAQGRRLFGLISAAGIVGGVLGPAIASAALIVLPVKSLLLVSSCGFAVAMGALSLVRVTERVPEPPQARRVPLTASLRAFREQPFLARVALVVFLSTATFLALDYLFKSSVARSLPGPAVGRFVAHYYLVLNVISLVVQLLMSGTVVRHVGVLPALLLTPLLLFGAALVAFATGGSFPGVLLVKGVDGSLRYSIHRVTGELMYLPVPTIARQRSKPVIDGALGRIAQTVTGAGLLALGGTTLVSPGPLAAIVAGLAALWLAVVLTMRRPYLRLLRNAITSGSLDAADSPEPLDLETAQMLVQRLASEDALEVEGAMTVLSRRGRAGFIPALVLLHRDEGVLVEALERFGESTRSDWFALARRLLDDPSEAVRMAAARALARHEQLDPSSLAHDVGWRARGYAAVRMALRDPSIEIVEHRSVATLLDEAGDTGEAARLGMLAAIVDAPPTSRLTQLLHVLAREPRGSRERTELFARAVAVQRDTTLVSHLASLLARREGREAVRAALVALGDPAIEEVWRMLRDPGTGRSLRVHIPKTIARFASKRAAERLLVEVETEDDGLVRYKAIQALRVLVTEHRIAVDRARTERLSSGELERHFRRLALRQMVGASAPPPGQAAAASVLSALLDEKAVHALERAFRLMQIAHPRQGVHHAWLACRSGDAYARATAAELLDTLLRRRDQQGLRALFRLATDDLPVDERVERARSLVPLMARSRDEAVEALVRSRDVMLAALGKRMEVKSCPTYEAGGSRVSSSSPLSAAACAPSSRG